MCIFLARLEEMNFNHSSQNQTRKMFAKFFNLFGEQKCVYGGCCVVGGSRWLVLKPRTK